MTRFNAVNSMDFAFEANSCVQAGASWSAHSGRITSGESRGL